MNGDPLFSKCILYLLNEIYLNRRFMLKNCTRRLKVEAQIAERGYANWEDIVQLLEVFPYFNAMYFQYNDGDIGNLRRMMCEGGYKLSYESYVKMFSGFVRDHLYYHDRDLYNQIMFK